VAAWQFKVALVPKPWLDAGGLIAALVTEKVGRRPVLGREFVTIR